MEAADCLKQTLESAVHQAIVADPVMIPLLQRFNGVYLQDGTTITLPDVLAHLWQGCGGSTADGPRAAPKAPVQFNLSDGQVTPLDSQAERAQDKTAPMQTATLPQGAFRIAALGYLSIPVLAEYDHQGVFGLTRYQANLWLVDIAGQALDLLRLLPSAEQAARDRIVQVSDHPLTCRLVAVRVPSQVAEARRRQLHAEAKVKGRTPRARLLALCAWVILLTNVPTERLSVAQVSRHLITLNSNASWETQ